ncbi:hypothetical protein [Enterococcus cecorum]|uniref:hypothetical protein n=1 Tax=Enterococcus cecorum TaxID=44008 RepID=UPI0032641970
MKRNYLLIVFVFVLPLLLAGCKDNEQKINPVKATTSQMKKQEDIVNDFMIMQVDNQGFPQSQGVFDYKKGVLHIVKQYIPEIQSSEEDTMLQEKRNYRQKIAADFQKTFPNQQFEQEPYSVYQRSIKNCKITDDGNQLYIHSSDYSIRFDYVTENKLIDENYVEYQIYR